MAFFPDPFNGLLILLKLREQKPHQMERFSAIGVDRKGLLAAELGVEKAAVPHVGKASRTECSRRGGAGIFRSLLGCLSCGPAFSAVHRRTSR